MSRLINTFRYGSWKTRLFFGAILFALLGGAATIAAAAFAGLGIIPIAIGGAAMVLGIGMSTMVTVVSDDNEEGNNGITDNNGAKDTDEINDTDGISGADGMPEDPGATKNPEGEKKGIDSQRTASAQTAGSREVTGRKTESDLQRSAPAQEAASGEVSGRKAESDLQRSAPVQEAASGDVSGRNTEKAGKSSLTGVPGRPTDIPDEIKTGEAEIETLEQAVQRIKDSVIRADDGGRYIPDEITEKPVPKASYVMKRVKNPVSISPSDGPFIDGLPPEKSPFAAKDAAGPEIAPSSEKNAGTDTGNGEKAGRATSGQAGRNSEKISDGKAPKTPGEPTGSQDKVNPVREKNKPVREIYSFDAVADRAKLHAKSIEEKEKAAGAEEKDNTDKTRGSIFGRLFSFFKRKDDTGSVNGEKPDRKAEKKARKAAEKRHFLQGKKTRKERKEIKRQIKEKTDEYEENLSEKFENEQSFADKEKLREERYAREIVDRKERRNLNGDENDMPPSEDEESKEISGKSGGFFKKLGGLFTKLFGNVYDEPETRDKDKTSSEDDDRLKPAKEEKNKKETKAAKKNNNKTDKKNTGTDKNSPKDKDEDSAADTGKIDRLKGTAADRAQKEAENNDEIRRERLPGEDIDVSKYTASNMKKIIKQRKLGKDFIPVFIENWGSKHIDQTPALCYVKDNHVHFLLLERDMERDVSVPTDKFINVWYKKNVPVRNLKAYKNIKDNMGAFEMFEDVMPTFATSTDQMGGTSYSQNLYLLGNDLALAPASMRELRKRFRFNTNIFDSLNTRGEYSDYFKKAYENRILWTDNVIGLQEYQRRIRAILQEMVNDDNLLKFEFEDDVAKMVQYRLITDEYADFYLNLKSKK